MGNFLLSCCRQIWFSLPHPISVAAVKPGLVYTRSPSLTRRPLRLFSPDLNSEYSFSQRMTSEKKVLYEAVGESHSEKTENKMSFLGSGHWFVWDPCGIICAVMTYFLILYGELVVLMVLAPPFPTLSTGLCVIIFTAFAVLAVISHVKAMITDPVSCPSK